MRAVFHRRDDPADVVGHAVWTRAGVEIAVEDGGMREALRRIFRATPVAADGPLPGSSVTGGPMMFQPASLGWFRAATRTRAASEGLGVRLVPEGRGAMGWDPAGAYRPFGEQIEREISAGATTSQPTAEAGEARPEGERGPSAPGTEAAEPSPAPSAAGPSEASEPPPDPYRRR